MKNYVIESYDYNTKTQECAFYHIQEGFEAETDEQAEQIFEDTIESRHHKLVSQEPKYKSYGLKGSNIKYALMLSSVDEDGDYFGMSDYVFDN